LKRGFRFSGSSYMPFDAKTEGRWVSEKARPFQGPNYYKGSKCNSKKLEAK